MPGAATTLPRGATARALAGSPRAVLVVMCAGYFLVLLDVTIVNVALPTIGCGLAPSVAALVAARVVQGVGAAALLPGTLAIISHAFPEGREQARAIGVWAGIGSLALPAGPLAGGALITAFGWRAIFLVN